MNIDIPKRIIDWLGEPHDARSVAISYLPGEWFADGCVDDRSIWTCTGATLDDALAELATYLEDE